MSSMVRTFRAADARSALAAVKAAMGPEAVILSTQQVGGGLFRKPEVEVTAALEPKPAVAPPTPPPATHGAARYGGATPPPPPPAETRSEAMQSQVSEELIALRSAVESMRQQLRHQVALAEPNATTRFPAPVMALFDHLVGRGLDTQLAEDLIRLSAGAHGSHLLSLWKGVRELLSERLVPSRAPWMPGPRRVVALVGPTGVGKTTTLAKIAARAVVETRLKVALITVDTYRIGAAEQVARYGHMMNLPTRVASNEAELAKALELSAGAELVLIDTAGRSRSDEVSRQAAMLQAIPDIQMHLCLSAATGARELAAAAARYSVLKPSRLIFTKLDEAVGPGAIVSALAHVGRPIACATNGQRVPEDIHALNGAQLVDLVAGDFKPH